jgi:site-specific DNA-cytosine methylase
MNNTKYTVGGLFSGIGGIEKVTKGIKIIRKLTPRECFSFQGFENIKIPKNISNAQLYKQAGNSVTIPLVTEIAKSIKKALATNRKS